MDKTYPRILVRKESGELPWKVYVVYYPGMIHALGTPRFYSSTFADSVGYVNYAIDNKIRA